MGCLKLSYYDNERVGLTVVRAGEGVNEKIARPDVTAAALFFRSGQQHTTVLNFLLLFGSSQKVGIVDEGRILHDPQTSSFTYEYHLRDHLGSVRVAFEPTTGSNEVRQINAYYPFGAPIAALSWSNQPSNPNRYQREGKEFISDFDWNKLDYHNRFFCPLTGRALQRDPLAYKFPWLSPYSLWGNNPVKHIDPDGRFFFIPAIPIIIDYLLIATGITATAYVAHEATKNANIGQAISGAMRDVGNAIGEAFSSPASIAGTRIETGQAAADNTQVQMRIPLADEARAASPGDIKYREGQDNRAQGKADKAHGSVQNAMNENGYGSRPPGGDPEPKRNIGEIPAILKVVGGIWGLSVLNEQVDITGEKQKQGQQPQQEQPQQQQEPQSQNLWERIKSFFSR